jgi:hypothetical protein
MDKLRGLRAYIQQLEERNDMLSHDMEIVCKRTNGGIECDSDNGPCACGAWHKPDDILPEQLLYPVLEVRRLRRIVDGIA